MNREILHLYCFISFDSPSSTDAEKYVENSVPPERHGRHHRLSETHMRRQRTSWHLIWIYSSKKLTNYFTFWNISQVNTVSTESSQTGTMVSFNITVLCRSWSSLSRWPSTIVCSEVQWEQRSPPMAYDAKRFSPCGPVISCGGQPNTLKIKTLSTTTLNDQFSIIFRLIPD